MFLQNGELEAWLKRMTRTMHGQGLKVASRDNFFERFALGETGKMAVAGGGGRCGCRGNGRYCNEAAGLGNGPVKKERLVT